MAQVFGIDLGTTYSAFSRINEQGMPEIIENFLDTTPYLASAVYFPEEGDIVVGAEAKAQAEVYPDRVVQFIKRQIGKPDGKTYTFNGVEYDPIMISSLILKRMKQYAEEQGYNVENVVITCPAYFKTEERMATKQAGEMAGLNVLNIVNEPTAAAMNYCIRDYAEDRKILVYDLGGGTFDVSIVQMSVREGGDVKIKVLESDGDDKLGGIDWDERLFAHMCALYADENGIDATELLPEQKIAIRGKVEEVKKALTRLPTRTTTISGSDGNTRIEITREKFEELTRDLVDRTLVILQRLLQTSQLSSTDIDTVLLVGGSTWMPMIKRAVEGVFGADKVRISDPDLAVAKGAALSAAIEWNVIVHEIVDGPSTPTDPGDKAIPGDPGQREELIKKYGKLGAEDVVDVGTTDVTIQHVDVLPCSFGPAVFTRDSRYMIDNLLFKGDESPADATKRYQTMRDGQPGVQIPIYENIVVDRDYTFVTPDKDENDQPQYTDPALGVKYLGVVEFELPAGTPAGSPIEVTFNYSTSGLMVTAENVRTGERFPVQITTPNTKTAEEMAANTRHISSVNTSGMT